MSPFEVIQFVLTYSGKDPGVAVQSNNLVFLSLLTEIKTDDSRNKSHIHLKMQCRYLSH